jgi:hypothetical protein
VCAKVKVNTTTSRNVRQWNTHKNKGERKKERKKRTNGAYEVVNSEDKMVTHNIYERKEERKERKERKPSGLRTTNVTNERRHKYTYSTRHKHSTAQHSTE